MLLRDYLNEYGAASRLARQLRVSVTTVRRWRDGESIPLHRGLMAKLTRATNGKVTANDFYRSPSAGRGA